MPLCYTFHPAEKIRAGIWHITETDELLYLKSGISGEEEEKCRSWNSISRRRQWLASRALLGELTGGRAGKIGYDEHGRPFAENGHCHISISHTGSYAAVAVSEVSPVGIDIEHIHSRIRRITEKFLNQKELISVGRSPSLIELYYYWCAKEAAFKISGNPVIEFRNDIYVHPIDYLCNINGMGRVSIIQGGLETQYQLNITTWDDQMLVVCNHP